MLKRKEVKLTQDYIYVVLYVYAIRGTVLLEYEPNQQKNGIFAI